MTRSRLLASAALGVTAAALLAWAFMPRPLPVEVAAVTRGRFETSIDEEARTRLSDRFGVTAPIGGRIDRIALREGDRVAAGQVLATVRPPTAPLLDDRALAEGGARLEMAQASLARARTRIESARVAVARAEDDLRRSELLGKEGFISPSRLENDRLAAQATRRELDTAIEGEHVATHELDQARAAMSPGASGRPAAPAAMRSVSVRAPIAGRVLRVHQGSENSVAAGAPLLDIGDLQRLRVVAELLTTDALQVRAGARVRIERWGGQGELAGKVERIEPGAFTKVSALGVEEQRVNVIIEITSPPAQWAALGDAYRVGVRIVTREEADVVKVPASAVFPRAGARPGEPAHAVFRNVEGRARLTPVALEARNADEAWIREGLEAGTEVIVYPPTDLRDGTRVRKRRPGVTTCKPCQPIGPMVLWLR